MSNRFVRAAVAAAGTTAIGAAAMLGGAATQSPVPAAPVILAYDYNWTCPVCGETWLKDENGLRQLELHTEIVHPKLWADITGGKK